MKILKYFIFFLILTMLIYGCRIYSFTGASIPKNARTVSIKYFANKAATNQPTISQLFTEKLKDIFIEQTDLVLSEKVGDLNFSGYISEYNIQPMGIQSNETPSQNRLTIVVNVNFENIIEPETNFEQNFSRYRDYEGNQNILDIEEILIEEIISELVEDIFNKSVVNW